MFFVYPVALRSSPLFSDPYEPGIQWALLAFPLAAAVVCLSLLPAVRRGAEYVRDNGTPWSWPWYPWMLFFMMGLGVCGRSYYLCLSMHMAGGFTTIFAPYFLVPFLLAANLLLLESGLVAGSVAAKRMAMVVPAALIMLAMIPPGGKLGLRFVHEDPDPHDRNRPAFLDDLGGRRLLRVGHFAAGIPCSRGPLGRARDSRLRRPGHRQRGDRLHPSAGVSNPGFGAIQALLACRQPSATRCFSAACCAAIGVMLQFPNTALTAYHGFIPAHSLLAAAMLLGAVFTSRFARWLQHAAAALLGIGAIVALTGSPAQLGNVPPHWLVIYPAVVILAATAYGWLVRNRLYFVSATATLLCWLGIGSVEGYRQLRPVISGLGYILGGAVSLAVAMAISLGKSGYLQRRAERVANGRAARPIGRTFEGNSARGVDGLVVAKGPDERQQQDALQPVL